MLMFKMMLLTTLIYALPVINYPIVQVPTYEQKNVPVNFYETETLTSLSLPEESDGAFKTYMSYRAITDKSSKQWKLQKGAMTDDMGFRTLDGKYLVAVGTYYANECGKELRVTLDSDIIIQCVVGDVKQNIHTDSNNQYVPKNGNIIEFIVDTKKLDSLALKMGDVSYAGLPGRIIKIEEVQ